MRRTAAIVGATLLTLSLGACKDITAPPEPSPAATVDIGRLIDAELCTQARYAIAHGTLNDRQTAVNLLGLADKRAVDPALARGVSQYYAALDANRDETLITAQCDKLGH